MTAAAGAPGPAAGAAAPRTRETRPTPADRPRPAPREAGRTAASTAPAATAAGATAFGEVRIAVTPWGEVEVDGASQGTAPPLSVLRLPEGRHQIIIRNADFPPHATSVVVRAGEPVTVRHRFGS
jgi:serine/threonine-protein kinase